MKNRDTPVIYIIEGPQIRHKMAKYISTVCVYMKTNLNFVLCWRNCETLVIIRHYVWRPAMRMNKHENMHVFAVKATFAHNKTINHC